MAGQVFCTIAYLGSEDNIRFAVVFGLVTHETIHLRIRKMNKSLRVRLFEVIALII